MRCAVFLHGRARHSDARQAARGRVFEPPGLEPSDASSVPRHGVHDRRRPLAPAATGSAPACLVGPTRL
eukprot:3612009-Prymnesium_polylepis.1